jgi:hypothetical protein
MSILGFIPPPEGNAAMVPTPTHLSGAQHRLLRACRNEYLDLPGLIRRQRIRSWLLARWFRMPRFRAEMAQVLLFVRRRRELDLALAATRAAYLLARAIAGIDGHRALPAEQAQICVALIRLARRRERRETQTQRGESVNVAR